MWAVVVLCVSAVLLWVVKVIIFPHDPFPSVRGPSGEFLFGNSREFNSHPEGRHMYLFETAKKYGKVFKLRFLNTYVLVNSEPTNTKEIYATQRSSFGKTKHAQNVFFELPNNIFTINGEEWRHRRQSVNPIFGLRHLKGTVNFINQTADTFFRVVEGSSNALDICPLLSQFTLEVMTLSAFGYPVQAMEVDSEVQRRINTIFNMLDKRMPAIAVSGYWKYFHFESDKKLNESYVFMKKLLKEIIEARRKVMQGGNKELLGDDLLSLLLEVEENDTILISDMVVFLIAGNHTTAMTLSWVIHFLTQLPDVQDKVQKEVDVVLQGKKPQYDDLAQLKYLTCVIKEAMRLKPVAWISSRMALEDVTIPGIKETIRANRMVMNANYTMHRDDKYWKDPDQFKPERFAAESVDSVNSWSYMPFMKGMRNCIGQKLAMIELQMMTAMLMQKYTIRMTPGQTVTDQIDFTLIPTGLVVDMWPRQ